MAEQKKVTLKRGKETLEVTTPTYGGITALESLGWKVESGSKPGKPRRKRKAETSFDEEAAREEIAASLRAELEEQIRAELKAEAEKAEDGKGNTTEGDKKPAGKK